MTEKKFQTVLDRLAGFNSINAWVTPAGELVISLSHRITDDEQVLVRVLSEADVILTDVVEEEYDRENPGGDGPWEDEATQLGRLNKGGNW